ncbi:MAG TPA: hypothetical protein HPP80_00765 [Rhodospirillaceae bacterium]|nr:hypothetical protein [Rhodospirillaceae bacterium]
MIDRRAFTFGLGSALFARAARAEVRINGVIMPEEDKIDKKTIPYTPVDMIPNHRQFMRDIVIELSNYGRKRKPGFIVLLRDAPELLFKEQREWEWEFARDPEGMKKGKYLPEGSLFDPVFEAIDGVVFDGLFYGRETVDQATNKAIAKYLMANVERVKSRNRRALSIEYCRDAKIRSEISQKASQSGVLSYLDATGNKNLTEIPSGHPPFENAQHVLKLANAQNILPIFGQGGFKDRLAWISALADTNFDLLLLDPFWGGHDSLTFAEMKQLKYKKLGAQRLIIAVLPIGLAQQNRFYWQKDWRSGSPDWLGAKDADDPNQFHVQYWTAGWKAIIGRYMQGLVDLGVDGVLLDGADAYHYFEEMMPLD